MSTDFALERSSSRLSFAKLSSFIIRGNLADMEADDSEGIAFNHRKGEAAGITLTLLL